MALETANYVNALVSANPPSGDPVTQADDHLRLIKAALVATFPNLGAPVTVTPLQLNSPIPVGSIHLWYSTVATIPAGYGYCDGSTYAKADGSGNIVSPDLRDRFVLGTGPLHAQATTGGNSSVSTDAQGGHTPAGTVGAGGAHDHGAATGSTVLDISQMPNHTHTTGQVFRSDIGGGGTNIREAIGSTGLTSGATGGGLGHNHTITAAADHTHSFTGAAVSAHQHTVVTVPPYYSLPYMIKL